MYLIFKLIKALWRNKSYFSHAKRIDFYFKGKKSSHNFCIFSVYQPYKFPDYLYVYFDQLIKNNFNIVLVSTAPIQESDLKKLKNICYEIIIHPNFGFDFGSYRLGILRLLKQEPVIEELLLTNDSVFGPLHDLSPLFKMMRKTKKQVFYLVENNQITHHGTSWFIFLKKECIQSKIFFEFWKNYKPFDAKRWAIIKGEMGFSKFLMNNFQFHVIFPQEKLIRISKRKNFILGTYSSSINCMQFLLPELSDIKMPFMKLDLYSRGGISYGLCMYYAKPSLKINLNEMKEIMIKKRDALPYRKFINKILNFNK